MVNNCAGYSTACVADLAFGMVISLMRNLAQCDTAVRNGGTLAGLIGNELEGKRFGIIGTGAIGMRVAKIADAFGCEVVAYSRTVKDVPYIKYMSLDEVMSTSDIISLHMPNNAETRGMISAEKIALMKKNAILINLARGPVLDSQALADALNSDKIAGACIDVYEMEPPIPGDHPLLNCKNTICTPHVAFASKEAMVKRAHIVFENIAAYMAGTPQNVMK
jgi:D-3-phosphoglycerate dehydrogenase